LGGGGMSLVVKLMGTAFDHVCRVLRLRKQNGDARSTAALLIIELMARGERNPSKETLINAVAVRRWP
jgi:hypothetical protein